MTHSKLGVGLLAPLLLVVGNLCHAKGQTVKLDGQFSEVRLDAGIVTFVFSGQLLDSSHPDERSGFPIWEFPIHVKNLGVTSRDAICMDHRDRRNFAFKDQPSDALDCFHRIEELVAAVPVSKMKFSGTEVKKLETEGLHFYGMEQVSP
jgi:hypothetical protein|tara:strand:+ start:1076 stop:1522 length:447 start_codon:yes stop_codon:yes gene_type:complete